MFDDIKIETNYHDKYIPFPKIINVRTDLPSLNPHDYLDFQLHYKPYLEFILDRFNGYISQTHFFYYMDDYFDKTKSQTKTILKKMIESNWLGQKNIGNKHKFLYLKRKARVCLEEKNLSDLPIPTNRIIIRTLLLEHFAVDRVVAKFHRNVYSIKKGFEPNDLLFADSLLEEDTQILFIDIVRRTPKQYAEFIRSFLEDERFDGKNVQITFLTYTEARKKTLSKLLKDKQVESIKATMYNPERLNFDVKFYDLLPYFDNKEPFL